MMLYSKKRKKKIQVYDYLVEFFCCEWKLVISLNDKFFSDLIAGWICRFVFFNPCWMVWKLWSNRFAIEFSKDASSIKGGLFSRSGAVGLISLSGLISSGRSLLAPLIPVGTRFEFSAWSASRASRVEFGSFWPKSIAVEITEVDWSPYAVFVVPEYWIIIKSTNRHALGEICAIVLLNSRLIIDTKLRGAQSLRLLNGNT